MRKNGMVSGKEKGLLPSNERMIDKHFVIVGSGFGGMAMAIRLRALGANVTMVERLTSLGGRAQVFKRNGFTHDAGPTVITAPFLFDELFSLFGKNREDYCDLIPLDTWYDFIFEDGSKFSYTGDLDHTFSQIRQFEPKDVKGYKGLLDLSESIFKVGFEQLSDQPFTKFWTMLKQLPALLKLQSYRTVYGLVSKYIQNEQLRKVFSIHPLLVGGNPFTTTSIYTLIHFLERKWGIHFARGGTGALVRSLEKLMIEEGVTIEKSFDVTKISIDPHVRQVTGIQSADGRKIGCDGLVFNGDPPYAYQNLLPSGLKRQRLRRSNASSKFSMGLFVLFFGTNHVYEDVSHHTIWLGKRHKELLKDIFDVRCLADDFSLYVHRPTATDKSFAPAGCDSFYVLCPVPNLQLDIDWDFEGQSLRDRIVCALEKTILPDLTRYITDDFWMSPRDFHRDYKSAWGAGFSIAPILSQSAYFRYHNRDPEINNLFFVGAGTHPGAGVPGVLSSAKVTEKLILEMAR